MASRSKGLFKRQFLWIASRGARHAVQPSVGEISWPFRARFLEKLIERLADGFETSFRQAICETRALSG